MSRRRVPDRRRRDSADREDLAAAAILAFAQPIMAPGITQADAARLVVELLEAGRLDVEIKHDHRGRPVAARIVAGLPADRRADLLNSTALPT